MKKTILLITALLTFTITHAQTPAKKSAHPAMALNDQSVDGIVTALKNTRGDYNKMVVIKNAIQNNTDGVTVEQELKFLNQFATDDSKLECAKFLYPWCVDYKNYEKIQYNMSTPAGQKAMKAFTTSKGGK